MFSQPLFNPKHCAKVRAWTNIGARVNIEKLLQLTHRQDRWRLHQALPRHYRRIQPDPASGASTDAGLLKLGSSLCSLSTSYLTGSCIEMKDTVINLQLWQKCLLLKSVIVDSSLFLHLLIKCVDGVKVSKTKLTVRSVVSCASFSLLVCLISKLRSLRVVHLCKRDLLFVSITILESLEAAEKL